jgi:hypothetical protein
MGKEILIDKYLTEKTEVKISVSKQEKRKVENALDDAGIKYNDMGDNELMATFNSPVEARKKMKQLPMVVSYTVY